MKVKLDLSNYGIRVDLENVKSVDTSNFADQSDSSNLKFAVYKLDIDKLKNVPTNL